MYLLILTLKLEHLIKSVILGLFTYTLPALSFALLLSCSNKTKNNLVSCIEKGEAGSCCFFFLFFFPFRPLCRFDLTANNVKTWLRQCQYCEPFESHDSPEIVTNHKRQGHSCLH